MKTKPKIEIDLSRVESLAAQGLTQQEIADALNVSISTVEDRNRTNKDFKDAIKKGRAKGLAVVTNKLFEKAREGDLGAICFYLKTRGGWSEKSEVKVDNRVVLFGED